MADIITLAVDGSGQGERVDAFIAKHIGDVSRSLAASLVRSGNVRVNDATVKPSYRLAAGDRVDVEVVRPAGLSAEPEEIPLIVVYEDRDLLVIDKPAGLVVHPAPGHEGGTLANALTARFPQTRSMGDAERPGIVHRLDKDTSGLMVVALNPAAQASLQKQIAGRQAGRRYLALATGHVASAQGSIEAPIGRDPGDRKRMAVHGLAARHARTSYQLLERLPGFDLLEMRLDTGRTHQIRVHLAAIGHPVAGDKVYHGGAIPGLSRQFLHACRLTLQSPSTGQTLEFTSPLPPDLQHVLDCIRAS